MSSTTVKNAMRDPAKVPTALDVDRHLNQYSRYARMVRGAARVAGLSSRLSWTNQGWVEQFRMPYGTEGEEAVLGTINLVKVPPRASIPISRALDEALAQRQLPEPIRQAIASAEGTQTKWLEAELTGPLAGDLMAAVIALKTEIIMSGAVSVSAAERFKPVPRPEGEAPRPVRPLSAPSLPAPERAPAPAAKAPSKTPVKVAEKPAAKRPSKAASTPPKKSAKAKPPARPISLKKPAAKKASAKSAKAKTAKRR